MLKFLHPGEATIADRCIRPLCFAAAGSEFYGMEMVEITLPEGVRRRLLQLGLQGSTVLFTYRSRYFSVFTRHQIALIPNETSESFGDRMGLLFALMDDGTDTTNIPFNGYLFEKGADQEDESDYVVGLVEHSMLLPYSREQFFPVERQTTGRSGEPSLVAGFPSHLQRVVMERDGLHIRSVCKSGTIRSRHTCGVMTYLADDEPLDGMSGGAVFILRLAEDGVGFQIFLDGIVQRGGNGFVRYLGIERVLDRIDQYLAGW